MLFGCVIRRGIAASIKGVNNLDYGGKYLKIRKALYNAGFDDFHQAGSVNRFHKMNIVAESAVLDMRFWICIDGGYGVKDEFYIVQRKLSEGGPDKRTYYNSQQEMASAIDEIGKRIRREKMKDKIYTHDEAMLIVEMFEDILCEYGIKVPSPEDDEREPDNEAALYGSTYSNLLDGVEAWLVDLLARHTPDTGIIQNVFSGTV